MTYKTTPYQRGRSFEYRVKRSFEEQGCLCIRQTKSSFPDLIVIKQDGKLLFVECKVDKKNISKDEKRKLKQLAKNYKAIAILAYRVGRKMEFDLL